jgi:hypothetical protein
MRSGLLAADDQCDAPAVQRQLAREMQRKRGLADPVFWLSER